MPIATIGCLRLEAFPRGASLTVIVSSTTGPQELTLSIAEWASLQNIEVTLDVAGEHVAELRSQRDQAVADVAKLDALHMAEIRRLDLEGAKLKQRLAELEAKQAAFVEAASHG